MKRWLLALALLPSTSTAGPWLRDNGAVFLSFGENLLLSEGAELPVHQDPFLYAEWGASARMTLRFSLYSGNAGREWTAEAFAIREIPLPEGWGVASYALGLAHREHETEPGTSFAGAGLAWGMDIDKSWLATELQVLTDLDTQRSEAKLDLTYGYHLNDRWAAMVQLQTGQGQTGDSYTKLAPSAIYRVNDRLRLNIGLTQGLTGDRGTGLFFGSWLDY